MDLSVFKDPRLLLISGLIVLAAVLSKLIGCGLGAFSLGRRRMLQIGVGMMPRGEVGMVVAQLGLTLGVIEKPVYAIVVFMAVATTLIAPPLLSLSFEGEIASQPEELYTIG